MRGTYLSGSVDTRREVLHFRTAQEGFAGVVMVTLQHMVPLVFTDWQHVQHICLSSSEMSEGVSWVSLVRYSREFISDFPHCLDKLIVSRMFQFRVLC